MRSPIARPNDASSRQGGHLSLLVLGAERNRRALAGGARLCFFSHQKPETTPVSDQEELAIRTHHLADACALDGAAHQDRHR